MSTSVANREFWNRGKKVEVKGVVWAEGTALAQKICENFMHK